MEENQTQPMPGAAPVMEQPQPVGQVPAGQEAPVVAKSSSGSGKIIALIAVVVVIIIGVVVGVVLMNSGKDDTKKDDTQSEEKDDKEEKEAIKKRDQQRQDDLDRLLTSVNSYQSNNNGKTPFSKDGSVNEKFITRYVDDDCETENGITYTGCDEFKDPSGKMYGFERPIYVDGDIENAMHSKSELDYKFHPFVNAKCGTEDEEILEGTGERQIAIMMILEGDDKYVCVDNH